MFAYFPIPLENGPQQVTVRLGGRNFTLTVRWNHVAGYWTLDIAERALTGSVSGETLVSGVPMLSGHDLLQQYGYLDFPGVLFVQTNGNVNASPTYENLGIESFLYFGVKS